MKLVQSRKAFIRKLTFSRASCGSSYWGAGGNVWRCCLACSSLLSLIDSFVFFFSTRESFKIFPVYQAWKICTHDFDFFARARLRAFVFACRNCDDTPIAALPPLVNLNINLGLNEFCHFNAFACVELWTGFSQLTVVRSVSAMEGAMDTANIDRCSVRAFVDEARVSTVICEYLTCWISLLRVFA